MTSKDPPIKYYVINNAVAINRSIGFVFTVLPDIAESTIVNM